MKKILIATDFSPIARNAAIYGTEMAKVIGAEVALLHIYQVPIPTSEVAVSINVEDLRIEATARMEQLKKELEVNAGQKVTIDTLVRMGTFYTELKMVCEHLQPYAVIMGNQGAGAAERLLFGSNAVYTMRHLTWPVITVPPGVLFSAIKKIGLACDFDNVIDSIRIDEIKRLVQDFDAALHVLNTGKESEFNPDVVFESGMLQGMLKSLHPRYHFISNDNDDDSILEFADTNQLDLLIVLPKRHSLVERLFHKSHTKQLVLHSHIPVMALHL